MIKYVCFLIGFIAISICGAYFYTKHINANATQNELIYDDLNEQNSMAIPHNNYSEPIENKRPCYSGDRLMDELVDGYYGVSRNVPPVNKSSYEELEDEISSANYELEEAQERIEELESQVEELKSQINY